MGSAALRGGKGWDRGAARRWAAWALVSVPAASLRGAPVARLRAASRRGVCCWWRERGVISAATATEDEEEAGTRVEGGRNRKGVEWFEWALQSAAERSSPAAESAIGSARATGRGALAEFGELVPQGRAEPWRYTDLRAIWTRGASGEAASPSGEEWFVGELGDDSIGVVVVDGEVDASLSVGLGAGEDWFVGSVASAPAEVDLSALAAQPVEVGLETENANAALGSAPWASLNAACLEDAAVVEARGDAELVVHVVHVSTGTRLAHPRLAVAAKDRSSVSLFQTFVDLGRGEPVCNSRTTLDVEPEASLSHVYALAAPAAYHLEAAAAAVRGRYELVSLGVGGRGRLGIECALLREEAHAAVAALVLVGANDTLDFRTQVRHLAPAATSDQDVRIVVAEAGRATFKGRIDVPSVAQQTDANQLCRSALLAPNAFVNVMPCLEIVADDVKCAHGATVADLDGDSLFFLTARGIPRDVARALLVQGFCDSLLHTLPDPVLPGLLAAVRAKIDSLVRPPS